MNLIKYGLNYFFEMELNYMELGLFLESLGYMVIRRFLLLGNILEFS